MPAPTDTPTGSAAAVPPVRLAGSVGAGGDDRSVTLHLPADPAPTRALPGLPASPVLPAAALDRLPAGPAGADPVWRLVAAFLVGYPPATARAYLGDLRAWIGWCAEQGVHPFTARRHHVDH